MASHSLMAHLKILCQGLLHEEGSMKVEDLKVLEGNVIILMGRLSFMPGYDDTNAEDT